MTTLTRTQRAALAALHETGRQWPLGQGRYRGDGPNRSSRWSRRTLQALVDAGLAQWKTSPGVLSHTVPVVDTVSSASRQHYIDTGRYLFAGEE